MAVILRGAMRAIYAEGIDGFLFLLVVLRLAFFIPDELLILKGLKLGRFASSSLVKALVPYLFLRDGFLHDFILFINSNQIISALSINLTQTNVYFRQPLELFVSGLGGFYREVI